MGMPEETGLSRARDINTVSEWPTDSAIQYTT